MSTGNDRSNTPQFETAQLAVEFGVQALSDAESYDAADDEVIRLCDEVIARRLRLQTFELEAGTASRLRVPQMLRDRALLRQPVGNVAGHSRLGDDAFDSGGN